MRRIKPPIAFLLPFWVWRDIWVRCIPKWQYKAIQGIVDGLRIAAVLHMGNRRDNFYAVYKAAYSVSVDI